MSDNQNNSSRKLLREFKENVFNLWGQQGQQDYLKLFEAMASMLNQYIDDDISSRPPEEITEQKRKKLNDANNIMAEADDWHDVVFSAKLMADALGYETKYHFYNVAEHLIRLKDHGNPHHQAESTKFLKQLDIRSKRDGFFVSLDQDELERWSRRFDGGGVPFNIMEERLVSESSSDIIEGGNHIPPLNPPSV
jgi:hypothetical protein